MIQEIVKDMATFAFVLLIAMVGFGNVFYILAVNALYTNPPDPDTDAIQFTGENNFLMALIYSFMTGLGNFSTDAYIGL